MGLSPKEKTNKESKNQPMQIMQRNHHLPIARGRSSHLLTSTNWWSSQKRVPHSRTHNNKSRV